MLLPPCNPRYSSKAETGWGGSLNVRRNWGEAAGGQWGFTVPRLFVISNCQLNFYKALKSGGGSKGMELVPGEIRVSA